MNNGRVATGSFLAGVQAIHYVFKWLFPGFSEKEKQIQSLVAKSKMVTIFSRMMHRTI